VKILLRIVVTFISGVAALYFVYWVGGALISSLGLPDWVTFPLSLLVAIAVAVAAARYVWVHTASFHAGLANSVVLGALTMGGIGFSLGFFGPILFMPGANQGPLLGIFITGPLGLLFGAVGGAVYWFARRRQAKNAQ